MHQDESGMDDVEGLVLKRKGVRNVELVELDVGGQRTGTIREQRMAAHVFHNSRRTEAGWGSGRRQQPVLAGTLRLLGSSCRV